MISEPAVLSPQDDRLFHIHSPHPSLAPSPPNLDKPIQPPVKLLTPNGHLDRIKRILHDEIRIQLIYLLHHRIHIRLLGFRKQQEFDARLRLEALDAEVRGLEDFDARGAHGEGWDAGAA